MSDSRLMQQMAFIAEIDKLKAVLRQTELIDGSRRENSAEHSWHIAVMALTLSEYIDPRTDMLRAVQMLLIHDIVEIDAGDTFAFDSVGYLSKAEREEAAALRIFGLLPDDQRAFVRALWDDFETGESLEARFATALDRLAGLVSNVNNRGGTWRRYALKRDAVMKRLDPIREGIPALWPYVVQLIDECVADGSVLEA